MSTKFSGIPKTQKPPAVCKAQPPPEEIPRPPVNERHYQGYVEWFDPHGSDDVALSGNLSMAPNPATSTWTGKTLGGPYVVQVEMALHPGFADYDFTITLLLNGSPVTSYQQLAVVPRVADPFDSGLVILTNLPSQARINCRIIT